MDQVSDVNEQQTGKNQLAEEGPKAGLEQKAGEEQRAGEERKAGKQQKVGLEQTLTSIRDRLDYQSALLGIVVLLTCSALALAYQLTREPIRQALEADMRQNFSEVLPARLYDNDLLQSQGQIQSPWGEISYFQATLSGQVTAVIFPIRSEGYAGSIEMLMAIKANGEISGVRVLVHQETPGLGDKIEANRDPWITGFNGKSLQQPAPEKWKVKKDGGVFDQFTGATITPRAVVKGIFLGLTFFDQQQGQLLYPLHQITPAGTQSGQDQSPANQN
ncbi:RnfABCDGE type electron transport complex subunit G [Oceanospirillum sediminis]|uniref:Ion-translocating oxidoreductase complex subunit G n=1 Tax=Oceanospirillum sediminis TaxID=2760088 RepID=A0A839IMQ5_9GAMM|nr:RnfABCDGE type electron transport complex subunit G [Oceanospirillum sediminis]MBB1486495.1 RnfABCDGE type electron transport complex subunit G [Oceanospirillum sediminis]